MNYPSNSQRDKKKPLQAKKRPEFKPVIEGGVTQKRKGLGSKIAETFTGDDINSVGDYILFDVILPTAKAMISDAISQGIERLLFGDSGSRRSRSASISSGKTFVNYGKMSSKSNDRPRELSSYARNSHDFDEVVVDDRGKAERILENLENAIDEYDFVTVADFYSMISITPSFTDHKYGWTSIKGASIDRDRQGYRIILPATSALD